MNLYHYTRWRFDQTEYVPYITFSVYGYHGYQHHAVIYLN